MTPSPAPTRDAPLRIGELAELASTTPRTIRYYEEVGLLAPHSEREQGQHRLYDHADVERVREIIRLRDLLNLSLDQLKALLEAETARAGLREQFHRTEDPAQQRRILEKAGEHIDTQLGLVRERKRELAALEEELSGRRRKVRARVRELREQDAG